LPEILKTFRQQYPEVKLILQEENSTFLLQRLQDQQVDIIFLYLYSELAEANDLETMTLTYEPFVLVLPEPHPLTSQAIVSLSNVKDEPFILHCAGGYRSVIAASLIKREGFHNVRNVVGGWNAIKELSERFTIVKEPAVLN
jgi:DNA-binding transcriptional LysR family regulator